MRERFLILRIAVTILFFVVNAFALFLMLRGHNLPGGGFIAGLATAISAVLMHMAFSYEEMRRWIRFDPLRLAVAGLALAVLTAFAPVCFGRNFFTHAFWHGKLPGLWELHLGTPLLFDLGVYLVVVGISIKAVFTLAASVMREREAFRIQSARYSSTLEQPIEEESGERHAD